MKKLVALLLLFIMIFSLTGCGGSVFEWDTAILSDRLPTPDSNKGEITLDYESQLSVTVTDVTKTVYNKYVTECKKHGYTIAKEQTSATYSAYNKDGYILSLEYGDSEMEIDLEAPEELEEINWSEYDISKKLPEPPSNKANISYDNPKDKYELTIGEISKENFDDYVKACGKKGYKLESKKSDNEYKAKNKSGNELTLTFVEYGAMNILLTVPKYEVVLELECAENLVFNTYDVEVYVDDDYETNIYHGDKEELSLELCKGTHELKIISSGDDNDVYGKIEFNIVKETKLSYKFTCYSTKISIKEKGKDKTTATTKSETSKTTEKTLSKNSEKKEKNGGNENKISVPISSYYSGNYEEAVKELKEAGFSNIKTKPEYTLGSGFWAGLSEGDIEEISINNKTEFYEGDKFDKKAEIVIKYKDLKIKDPSIKYESYTVETLMADLDNNALNAKEKYLDKYVAITGRVDNIDDNGDFWLMPGDNPYAFQGVMCDLENKEQKEQVSKLSKGDIITVRGKISLVGDFIGYSLDVYKIG